VWKIVSVLTTTTTANSLSEQNW